MLTKRRIVMAVTTPCQAWRLIGLKLERLDIRVDEFKTA